VMMKKKNETLGGKHSGTSRNRLFIDTPLVSIITPVLNGAKHIEETILSVIGQSYTNIEYIVIDGGSTDGTLDLINKYQDKIDCWISEKDKGIADAFNKGVSRANGEWVGIINADDWYELDAIENLVKMSSGDIVYGDMRLWRGCVSLVCISNHVYLNKVMSLNHPSIFVRNKVYKEFGSYNLKYKYAMDYEFLLRAMTKGVVFQNTNIVFSNFRTGGASDENEISAINEVKKIKVDYKIKSKIFIYIDYLISISKAIISRLFRKMGLAWLVSWYSNYFSVFKRKDV